MDLLLLFFAIPLAVIILSIVLQKILKCPWLVAATFFAIFLIVTFSVGDIRLLIFTVIYTIISYITALIFRAVCNFMCNGITLRNINTRNINTNTLNANQVIDNGDNSIDENNNNNGCSCSCGNCCRGNCSYNLNRNYYGYNCRCRR